MQHLAHLANVGVQTVEAIELGQSPRAAFSLIVRLASLLDLDASRLATMIDEEPKQIVHLSR